VGGSKWPGMGLCVGLDVLEVCAGAVPLGLLEEGGELLDMCAGARPAHVHTSSTFPLGTLGPRIGHFRARYQAMWQCNTCSMQLQYAAMCRAGSWTKLCVTA
jgi:hypothetical protein